MSDHDYKKLYEDTSEELEQCQVDAKKAAKLLMRRDIALTEANNLLRQTNKAKSEFISLAAHQLRSPVATINWYISNLVDGKEKKNFSEKQESKLLQIQSSSKHMAELIDTFLLMSRLELGTSGENRKDIDFDVLLNDIKMDMNYMISQKNITYETAIDVNTPVCADRNMLKSIVENLISNAVKYTPKEGSVTSSFSVLVSGKDFGGRSLQKESLCVKVIDTGLGIPKEQQGRIFERLFRADNVLSKDIQGTGLGLYIVKLMILQFGGDIWFSSVENEGTSFFVSIPVHMISAC